MLTSNGVKTPRATEARSKNGVSMSELSRLKKWVSESYLYINNEKEYELVVSLREDFEFHYLFDRNYKLWYSI